MYTSQLYVISCRVSIHFLQNFNTFFIIVVSFIYIFSVFYVFLLQILQFYCNLLLCFCHNLFREFHEFQQLDCIARCHSSRIQPVIKINIILSDPLCKIPAILSIHNHGTQPSQDNSVSAYNPESLWMPQFALSC